MTDELDRLAAQAVESAARKNKTLAFAESCTGGLIAAAVTSVPGASAVFQGSAVTYSNDAKHDLLGVSYDVLERFGAVSAECAEQMAIGAKRIYRADLTVSVTGIAGPGGGTPEKPVGTVWFGFAAENGAGTFMRLFAGGRDAVRAATVSEALRFLLKELS
jgi:PncC family amidohydrolase